MLRDYPNKVKSWIESNTQDLYIAAVIFLVGMASFGLGRLSVLWPAKEPIRMVNPETYGVNQGTEHTSNTRKEKAAISGVQITKGKYVASKSGTAYHYPWCPGALKIKEENKIWFPTKGEAEKAGYKPAGNCEGL